MVIGRRADGSVEVPIAEADFDLFAVTVDDKHKFDKHTLNFVGKLPYEIRKTIYVIYCSAFKFYYCAES